MLVLVETREERLFARMRLTSEVEHDGSNRNPAVGSAAVQGTLAIQSVHALAASER